MSGRFSQINVGDQVEMPRKRHLMHSMISPTLDPNQPVAAAVVTHIWHDPVEDKEFIALAPVLSNGTVGRPRQKHTRRGLAQAGWFPARQDWLAFAQALADGGGVVPLSEGRKIRQRPKMPGGSL